MTLRLAFVPLLCLLFFVFSTQVGLALTCNDVKLAIDGYKKHKGYLDLHIKFNNFDNELSARTFDNFIRYLDPGKMYLHQKDMDKLSRSYRFKLDEQIARGDCAALNKIVNTYSQRFNEIETILPSIIKQKHDFSIDEKLLIDRKGITFVKSKTEMQERWRKWIKYQLLRLKSAKLDMHKARAKLQKRYKLERQRFDELDSDDIRGAFLDSFANSLDPHSDYFSLDQLEDFQIRTRLSLEGIGAVLRSDDGFTTIQSLVPGGAAYKSKLLRENDKIIAVAQKKGEPVDIINMDLREVVKLIRGKRGTPVKLTVLREKGKGTSELQVTIVREKIELKDQEVSSQVYKVQAQQGTKTKTFRVGVVELPSFYIDFDARRRGKRDFKSSSRDLRNELHKLTTGKEKIDALVLDLRNNGGGSLDESVFISGLFIDQGVVVQDKLAQGSPRLHYDRNKGVSYRGSLVVLINRNSASGSEIVAGAIQDYQLGLIVGDKHTFGKGTVQSLTEVDGVPGALKVTISKFYRPSGASTQKHGVAADIVLPSFANELEIGEKFLDHVLSWEEIKAGRYTPVRLVNKEMIAKLASASKERVASNKEFQKLSKKIDEFRKENRSSVSLQEKSANNKKQNATTEEEEEEEEKQVSDLYLQEAMRIAVDYSQMQAGKKLLNLGIFTSLTKKN